MKSDRKQKDQGFKQNGQKGAGGGVEPLFAFSMNIKKASFIKSYQSVILLSNHSMKINLRKETKIL